MLHLSLNRAPVRAASLLAAAMFVGSGCGVSGLSFFQDDRISINTPSDQAEVSAPLTVQWTVKDFSVGPGMGSFGILVDRTPPKPGKTLASMFGGGDACRSEAECGAAPFLAERNVYATSDTTLILDRLPKRTGDDRNRHDLTIVLLDAQGRRVGEGAWTVQVDVRTDKR